MNTQHPLVAAYQEDLSRLLTDLDPGERAEVLAGVREHVDASLAGRNDTDDADVRAVLAELGPPEAVAQEAYAGHVAQGSAKTGPRPPLARIWVPVVVAILQALGLLVIVMTTVGLGAYSTMEVRTQTGEVSRTVGYEGSALAFIAVGLVVMLPSWLPAAVLVGISGLWARRDKLAQILILPAAAVLVATLPEAGWALAGERGLNAGAWVGTALAVGGGGWLLWRVTSRGVDQAQAERA